MNLFLIYIGMENKSRSKCSKYGRQYFRMLFDCNISSINAFSVSRCCFYWRKSNCLFQFRERSHTIITSSSSSNYKFCYHWEIVCSLNYFFFSYFTFKTFDFSDFIILDPSFLEDKVCDNKLSICFNNHRELCGVDIEGCACLSQELLMNCSNQAATIAVQLVDKIKFAIQTDTENR